jgi:hypothetical protein
VIRGFVLGAFSGFAVGVLFAWGACFNIQLLYSLLRIPCLPGSMLEDWIYGAMRRPPHYLLIVGPAMFYGMIGLGVESWALPAMQLRPNGQRLGRLP